MTKIMSRKPSNDVPPHASPVPSVSPASRAAEEAQAAHRDLHEQFARIEGALADGDLPRGAQLLADLINQAREHFINEENIALSAGLTTSAADRMKHDLLMERARTLKARCLNSPANTDFRNNMEGELVVLLSDLVESDLRVAHRLELLNDSDG